MRHPAIRFLAIGALLSSLSACEFYKLEELNHVEPTGTPFQKALAQNYHALSLAEQRAYDWSSAVLYAGKSLEAAYGNDVSPEELAGWNVPDAVRPQMEKAREDLLLMQNSAAKEVKPQALADAQTFFDCWLEQQDEGWQSEDISYCRDKFYAAMSQLMGIAPADTAMSPVKKAAVKAETKPKPKMEMKPEAEVAPIPAPIPPPEAAPEAAMEKAPEKAPEAVVEEKMETKMEAAPAEAPMPPPDLAVENTPEKAPESVTEKKNEFMSEPAAAPAPAAPAPAMEEPAPVPPASEPAPSAGNAQPMKAAAAAVETASYIVFFNPGEEMLTDMGQKIVDKAAEALKPYATYRVIINSHTDTVGSTVSRELPLQRAQAVRDRLVLQGIDDASITLLARDANEKEGKALFDDKPVERKVEIFISE